VRRLPSSKSWTWRDKEERDAQVDTLTKGTGAESVQQIGHVVVLFRRNADEPKLALPR
jgi:RNA-binding protein